MNTLQKIDDLLNVLDRLVADLRQEAEEAGFCNISLQAKWSCIDTASADVRVFLSTGARDGHGSVMAPTAEDAYTECVRRINWQRDVAMRQIAPPQQED